VSPARVGKIFNAILRDFGMKAGKIGMIIEFY
jgi:hypothetical protein